MTSTCSDSGIMAFVKIIKTIFTMIEIIAPIILVVSLGYLFFLIVTASDIDVMNKTKDRIKNAVIATVVVFFIPIFINLVFLIMGEKFELSSCWKNVQNPLVGKSTYIDKKSNNKKKTSSFIINPSDYKNDYTGNPNEMYTSLTGGSNTSYSSGDYKGKLFSPETLKIVNEHKDDFNYYNFRSFMAAHGGAGTYIKSLGGVFEKYYGKNVKVKNQEEFHEVCEYVFGLMTIWGFDYKGSAKYCKWGGKCGSYNKASSDAFYPAGLAYNNHGYPDRKHFDKMITGKKDLNMTTCCNAAVDMVYNKAGLFTSNYGASYTKQCSKQKITSLSDAKVGDIIHFFKSNINRNSSPSTWHNWYHVAFIGEVYPDKIVGYDGGSYFTKNRNYKWEAKKSSNKVHGTTNWAICRPVNIGS